MKSKLILRLCFSINGEQFAKIDYEASFGPLRRGQQDYSEWRGPKFYKVGIDLNEKNLRGMREIPGAISLSPLGKG